MAREFLSLTNEEIKQIVTDMFSPKKITCIKKSKKYDEITCNIYTEWGTDDDDGGVLCVCDELTLRNPFVYNEDSISVDFQVKGSDYTSLKQFCFAKGIVPDWIKNNPYMENNPYK